MNNKKYIHFTNSGTYAVRVILSRAESHRLGTFKSEQEAIEVRDKFLMAVDGNLNRLNGYSVNSAAVESAKAKQDRIDEARRLYKEGMPVIKIAHKLDLKESTVHRYVRQIKPPKTWIPLANLDPMKRDLLYSAKYFRV